MNKPRTGKLTPADAHQLNDFAKSIGAETSMPAWMRDELEAKTKQSVASSAVSAGATLAAETITNLFGVRHVNDIDFTTQRAIDAATEKLRAERDKYYMTVCGLLYSGLLDKATCEQIRGPGEELAATMDALRAELTLLQESHDALARECEGLRADKGRLQFYAQWYPVKEMLPLSKAEGAERNYVLAVWMKNDKLLSMRTCFCDSAGEWWLTPESKTKTEPHYWRELPDFPTVARAAMTAQKGRDAQ